MGAVDSLISRRRARGNAARHRSALGLPSESRGARAYRALYAVEARPIITGEELIKATARRDR